MRIQDVVIHDSEQLTAVHRGLFGLVTVAAWGVFAWLMQPVLTLVVWLISGYVAYEQVGVRLGGIEPTVIITIAAIAFLGAVALVTWAEYNRARFRGDSQRERRPDAMPHEMASEVGLSTLAHGALSKSRIISVGFDEDGSPSSVRVLRSHSDQLAREGGGSGERAIP